MECSVCGWRKVVPSHMINVATESHHRECSAQVRHRTFLDTYKLADDKIGGST
jgi:hypothetical protein